MLLTSPRIRHLKSMVNCTLQITTICDNVTDRRMYNCDHFFCVISVVAPKSPSNPKKYFCKEISIFVHSRLSVMNDSHCLDSMHVNTPPRNTMGKQTLPMKGKTNSNLESIERHGMATMKTTEKVIIKKNNNNQISNGLSCLSRDCQQQQFVHSMEKRTMMYFKEFFTIHSRR